MLHGDQASGSQDLEDIAILNVRGKQYLPQHLASTLQMATGLSLEDEDIVGDSLYGDCADEIIESVLAALSNWLHGRCWWRETYR